MNFMKVLGDWYLIRRAEEQLLGLAREAGLSYDECQVRRMPDNVISYLHIQKS